MDILNFMLAQKTLWNDDSYGYKPAITNPDTVQKNSMCQRWNKVSNQRELSDEMGGKI